MESLFGDSHIEWESALVTKGLAYLNISSECPPTGRGLQIDQEQRRQKQRRGRGRKTAPSKTKRRSRGMEERHTGQDGVC